MRNGRRARVLILMLAAQSFWAATKAAELTLTIPPVKTSFKIENQPVTVTASGIMSRVAKDREKEIFRLTLTADLLDLQQNMTVLLRSQLDRSDQCGERIAIQHATLAPIGPAGLLTAQLHYERWACAKAFGKQIVKRLVAGNAVVPVKLTPSVEGNAVRLEPEIGNIQADGSLGDLLRSPSFGATLREKIRSALASAIQKGANLAVLPPAVESVATLQHAQFKDAGAGRLAIELGGEVHISAEQAQLLVNQLKEHTSTR